MANSETKDPKLKCYEHSTFVKNIADTELLFNKFDKIYIRINIILGGIAVSCILLAVNLLTHMK